MSDPKLDLSLQFAVKKSERPRRSDLRRWVKAALMADALVGLRIVDEAEGRALNQEYRGKDYATNVLTFAYGLSDEDGRLSGDIVICAPVVAREAAEQGVSLEEHYAHLTLHGMLHLQGYDHETDAEAVTMESIESFIMQRLGYSDPYDTTPAADA
jgi:probable rRNA maturation factor